MRINLTAEFNLAMANLNEGHFQHLADTGVSFKTICRAGDLGVERINASGRLYMPAPDGFPVVIMAAWSPAAPSIYCAVENPVIIDLIALRTDEPGRWWYRMGEPVLILGEDRYLDAIAEEAPLKVFDSPLDWLRGNCGGTCFLDDCEARWSVERYAEDEIALRARWEAAA